MRGGRPEVMISGQRVCDTSLARNLQIGGSWWKSWKKKKRSVDGMSDVTVTGNRGQPAGHE